VWPCGAGLRRSVYGLCLIGHTGPVRWTRWRVIWGAAVISALLATPFIVPSASALVSDAGSQASQPATAKEAVFQAPPQHDDSAANTVSSEPNAKRPLLLVVGASFTEGVGASRPAQGWPHLLAQKLGFDCVVRGVPGAGYVRAGRGGAGPVAKELAGLDVARLNPAVVIVQAGHNDIGEPLGLVGQQVGQVVDSVQQQAPNSKIALITVFRGKRSVAQAEPTDQTIVNSARAADADVAILDPMAQRWAFPVVSDHLHPTQAGHSWIADRVMHLLEAVGVQPVPPRQVIADPAHLR
jgi:lysophospholipase L1-like esterase